jgi:xanthine dehydrogenase YagS FAD-binding subunit
MKPFTYLRVGDTADAVRWGREPGTRYLGGGTNLVDLLRETLEQPDRLVDVTALSTGIEPRDDGSLIIGAAVRNTALAAHPAVRDRFPMLSRAIMAGRPPRCATWPPSAAT